MRAQTKFDDWSRRRQMWPGRPDPNLGIATIAHVGVDALGYARECWLNWTQPIENECAVGEEFLLLAPLYGLQQRTTGGRPQRH